MASRAALMKMVKLGRECRAKHLKYDADFKNPAPVGTYEADAWIAGYKNDLDLFVRVLDCADEPVNKIALGRLRPHDSIIYNAHTSKPLTGEFQGYVKGRPGWARVLLDRSSTSQVPLAALTRLQPGQAVSA